MSGAYTVDMDTATDRRPADALPPLQSLDLKLLLALVAVKLAIHLPLLGRYGYFRDELYFLDCGRHLAWGYVDLAPLTGWIARLLLELGGSLWLLRLVPALAGAALVALTMVLAQRLGGGRFAQGLAGVAVIVVPVLLAFASLFTMNALEPLFWTGCALAVVQVIRSGDSRWWLVYGAVAGVGLMNKHSMLFFGFATAVAVLLTPLRRELGRRWIWLGAGIALLLFLPNIVWQAANDFPTLEDLSNVREIGKNVELAPTAFVVEQILIVHPVLAPVWLAGLWALFAGRARGFRAIGWIFVVVFTTLLLLKGKSYYVAPIYPLALAAGGVAFEGWTERLRVGRARLSVRAAVLAIVVLLGALLAPMFVPVLAPEDLVAYQNRIGLAPSKTEVAHVGPLPQYFGDQFGWPELVAEVARIFHALPEEEREVACIFAGNYGEAGAVNLFGPEHGLPRAISGHQTHWFWGPGDCTGEVVIVLQGSAEGLAEVFTSVEEAGSHHHPWGMAEENRPIHVARGIKVPLDDLWPQVKHWN
jgi:hypothetical protein